LARPGTSPAIAVRVMRSVVWCVFVLTWLVVAQPATADNEKQPKHDDKKAQTHVTQAPKVVPTRVVKPRSTPTRAASKPVAMPALALPTERPVEVAATATPLSKPRAQVQPVATPREPTLEPTRETEILDVATDANARSSRTALPSPTVAPTPIPSAVAVSAAATPMHDVVAESFEPMLVGGRIGLIGGAVTGLGALALHVVRRRR
jgi:hypothetical protein